MLLRPGFVAHIRGGGELAEGNLRASDPCDVVPLPQALQGFLAGGEIRLLPVDDQRHRAFRDFQQGRHRNVPAQVGKIAGIVLHLGAGRFCFRLDRFALLGGEGVIRDEDRLDGRQDRVDVRRHRDPVHGLPGALFVHHRRHPEGRILQLVEGLAGRLPGPDDRRGDGGVLLAGDLFLFHQEDPVGKPDDGQEEELQRRADQVIGHRHPADEQRRPQDVEHTGHQARPDDPVHVVDAHIPPHAAVEPEQGEHEDAQHRVERRELLESRDILCLGNGSEFPVHKEAHHQRDIV